MEESKENITDDNQNLILKVMETSVEFVKIDISQRGLLLALEAMIWYLFYDTLETLNKENADIEDIIQAFDKISKELNNIVREKRKDAETTIAVIRKEAKEADYRQNKKNI
ncbi:hypothetical protein [Mucispirillum schaedleri]|uniref:hypothetical protein n=1 Tax=Mucispirillum schaedleri TaxID=248039 RepID=UPI001F563E95|nr:hypothetical protein [Mucispirillum schaedleri]